METGKSLNMDMFKIIELKSRIRFLLEKRELMKRLFPEIQKPIDDRCLERIKQFKADYDAVIIERKSLEAELAALEYIREEVPNE
ncbi:hypothetical protein [Paenibacillus ehimensis]|uniref:hypothetical protein n=1 Tax=Paenibacillus ehimensis TaxID=79264 RepID=UPI000472CBE0|nr:hypothetical protein [Paenibacillus ehimensis]